MSESSIASSENLNLQAAQFLPRLTGWVASTRSWVGDSLQAARDSDWMKQIGRSLGANWLLQLLDQVNLRKVRETVEALQREHPDESPAQLSARLISRKAFFAGGIGVASGLLPPGINLPAIAADVVGTLVLEIELIYEIACAHGLDLDSPDRKGEAALVLALGTGADRLAGAGTQALKRVVATQIARVNLEQLARIIGKQLAERLVLKGVPMVVGAVVGGGTNLAAINLIGNAAAHFYESQITVQAEASKEAA
ncbi:EcsC family protein [Gloeobacter kilaueensis]|uniref:EcsC family protein n=1 Tax=Gloeobacter kilaueensis (strain ATCC BAA-2537 / CCAP 1431/1 / ULC 316 / JS1) TaxID=1183438 RepID=U5QHG0_GLOK1|nr:EcsC family protein [Gloeobacter kilaueensis]AGY57074.1 hypothetical protein GKIL_0828 [Gloeobacter kilaueensis JS1]